MGPHWAARIAVVVALATLALPGVTTLTRLSALGNALTAAADLVASNPLLDHIYLSDNVLPQAEADAILAAVNANATANTITGGVLDLGGANNWAPEKIAITEARKGKPATVVPCRKYRASTKTRTPIPNSVNVNPT